MALKLKTFTVPGLSQEIDLKVDKDTGYFEATFDGKRFVADTATALKARVAEFVEKFLNITWTPVILVGGEYSSDELPVIERVYVGELGGNPIYSPWSSTPENRMTLARLACNSRGKSDRRDAAVLSFLARGGGAPVFYETNNRFRAVHGYDEETWESMSSLVASVKAARETLRKVADDANLFVTYAGANANALTVLEGAPAVAS